ncbi:MAG TPA: hypothetical protein VFP68_07600 [Burkholderiaceae bacterium]|nr:hypothetical protein [Burkholderiaceae bacterium]
MSSKQKSDDEGDVPGIEADRHVFDRTNADIRNSVEPGANDARNRFGRGVQNLRGRDG